MASSPLGVKDEWCVQIKYYNILTKWLKSKLNII
jgi:hypothetical protein